MTLRLNKNHVLFKTIKDLDCQIEALLGDKKTLLDDKNELQKMLVQTTNEKDSLMKRISLLEDERNNLNQRLTILESTATDKEKQLNALLKEMETKYNNLLADFDKYKTLAENEQKDNAELKKTIKTQEEKIQSLQAELEQFKLNISRLENNKTELQGELGKRKDQADDERKRKEDLEKTKKALEDKNLGLQFELSKCRLNVIFKGDILFESGKFSLRKEGEELLKNVFPELQKRTDDYEIFVVGHTDNVPIREDLAKIYKSNWELSNYRATEVVKFLVSLGIKPESLSAAGCGEYKPRVENTTETGKSKNRRVEIFLIPKIIKRSS